MFNLGRFLSKIDKFAQIQFMKNTALTSTHIALNAKMVPFAGYNMPVSYEGVNAEHETVRKGVGVFDVSHMGEFLITGENALECFEYRKGLELDLAAQHHGRYHA